MQAILLQTFRNLFKQDSKTLYTAEERLDLISRTGTFDLTDRETELYVSVKNELFRYAIPGGKLISRETLADTKSTVWDSQEKYVITTQKNCW